MNELKDISVSIIVPVYNVEPYLKQCLDTLVHQTLSNIEIICVNDGSTDNSLAILQEYEHTYHNLVVLNNTIEGDGAAEARNRGLEKASGEYLLILDSDDYFSLELAEKLYQKAKETYADIVIFDVQHFDSSTGAPIQDDSALSLPLKNEKRVISMDDYPDDLWFMTHGAAWNKFYRKQFIQDHNLFFQPVHVLDDAFFTFCSLAFAKSIVILPEILLFYRMNNNNSQVHHWYRDPLSPIKVWSTILQNLKNYNKFQNFKVSYYKRTIHCIYSHLNLMKIPQQFETLYNTLRNGGLVQLGFYEKGIENILDYEELFFLNLIKGNNIQQYFYNTYFPNKLWLTPLYKYQFPTEKIANNESILLYGGGEVGKVYFLLNSQFQYCNIVAWVDKNFDKLGFPLKSLDTIFSSDYDKILIAIEKQYIADLIKEDLINQGIPEEKIVWESPI